MRKKIFHLSTCDTCKRIIKELGLKEQGFEFQDIKTEKLTEDQLEEMRKEVSSYEELFSKRSRQYSALGLKEKSLSEEDLKNLIIKEYTFLKRPVIWIGNDLFVGNSKSNIEAAKQTLNGNSNR